MSTILIETFEGSRPDVDGFWNTEHPSFPIDGPPGWPKPTDALESIEKNLSAKYGPQTDSRILHHYQSYIMWLYTMISRLLVQLIDMILPIRFHSR